MTLTRGTQSIEISSPGASPRHRFFDLTPDGDVDLHDSTAFELVFDSQPAIPSPRSANGGVVAMTLLVLTVGTVVFMRKRQAA